MKKVNFLFGIHCHQPVGNFGHVFDEAYEKAYLPFIKVLENHPRIKVTVHYSGILFDWFKQQHPEFIDLLRKLVRRGQLEILSSGYYEPILSIIPDEDKVGQIEKMNHFIREEFGMAPRGMWLTERVWEPSLPKPIVKAGIEYTMVDDHHFKLAGIEEKKLNGYFVTEDQGETLNLFPINKKLRQMIPFNPPEEIIEYLQGLGNKSGSAAAVCLDDGEKLGLQADSHKFIYEEGYLEKLFTELEANAKWIRCMTLSDYIEEYPPKGRAYLPTASYEEMMEWSGGYFRNFFIKYPEANNMHKRMLQVSNRLASLRKGRNLFGSRENDEHLVKALDHLYQAQCACAYWHGLYNGLYSGHLRRAVYENLIKAEVEMERFSRRGNTFIDVGVTDLNKDGKDEVILTNNMLSLFFAPLNGGTLFELDYKLKPTNVINSIARHKEDYHKKKIAYDNYSRACLVDHFFTPDMTFDKMVAGEYKEAGDFVEKDYTFMPRRGMGEIGITLARDGNVEKMPVKVEKTVSLLAKQSIINIEYTVTNQGKEKDEFWFGIEFNFSISGDRSKGEVENLRLVKMVDGERGFDVSLELDKNALVWRFPVETVSRSDTGIITDYQSSAVIPSWKFSLEPNQSWKVQLTLRIEE